MNKVKVKKISYGQWGNCVKISNDIVELVATLDFGPRIIRFSIIGKENMFFEDKEFNITNTGEEFKVFGKDKEWKIYGGHRLWVSPEMSPRTYYPDNEKVEWVELENGVILSPKEEKWSQVKKEIEIRLEPNDSKVRVIHRVTNIGAWPIQFAPWALSVMAPGGVEIIPQPKRETGLLGNRVFVLWPYSKMNDERVCWGEKYIILKQDKKEGQAFKVGINNELGWAAYFNNDCLFIKSYDHKLDVEYPDFGVSYETYTNSNMLEMETLGEFKITEPGEQVEHIEEWALFGNIDMPINDENEIEKVISQYNNTHKR